MRAKDVKCGDMVLGTGSQVGEPDGGCDDLNLKFELLLLDLAKGNAETDARAKCPAGCQQIEWVGTVHTQRVCAGGVVTVTYTGKYRCTADAQA